MNFKREDKTICCLPNKHVNLFKSLCSSTVQHRNQGLQIIRQWQCSLLSRVWLFAIPWTVAHQAPLSMGFSRQEYWSGLPFPSPEYLSNPGIEPGSSALKADSLPFELQGRPTNYLLCDTLECVLGKQHKLVNQHSPSTQT